MFDIKAWNLLGWNKTLQKKNYGILNVDIFFCSKPSVYNIYKTAQLGESGRVNALEDPSWLCAGWAGIPVICCTVEEHPETLYIRAGTGPSYWGVAESGGSSSKMHKMQQISYLFIILCCSQIETIVVRCVANLAK